MADALCGGHESPVKHDHFVVFNNAYVRVTQAVVAMVQQYCSNTAVRFHLPVSESQKRPATDPVQVNREARVDCALAELYTRSVATDRILQEQKHAEVLTKLYSRMNEVSFTAQHNNENQALLTPWCHGLI